MNARTQAQGPAGGAHGSLPPLVAGGNAAFPDWMALVQDADLVDPFCSTPAWQMPYHAACDASRPLVVEVTNDAALTFVKVMTAETLQGLIPIEDHWHYGCPLLGPGAVERVSNLMRQARREKAGAFKAVIVSGVRTGGRLERELRQAFGSRLSLSQRGIASQCFASLADGLDGYLSRRSSRHRKNLRREARRANDHGVTFERVSPTLPGEASDTYARMAAVEERSWKGIGQCGMTAQPMNRFYSGMLEWLSHTGESRVVFARHGEVDIGFIYGGMVGRIYRGQQFSFDDAWKDYSIGNLLQLEQIAWLCEEGAERYDMGPSRGPSMAYKRHWTETEQSMTSWRIAA